jgi:hypothetical protein
MRRLLITLAAACTLTAQAAVDLPYRESVEAWRKRADESLRRDNGWLTLAGRFVLKPGRNSIGTGRENDVVFPAQLGPTHLGEVVIDGGRVILRLADGVRMRAKEGEFSGERTMIVDGEARDWVHLGRTAFHFIQRNGRTVLRLADNESPLRASFPGRIWFDVAERYKVVGRYVPYAKGRTVQIVNVLDEVSDQPSPGYVEFTLNGRKQRLDAVAEDNDKDLFIILKDRTAGKGTYGAGRFLVVEWPQSVRQTGGKVTIDFNKAYNPPCAFSDYTTCPLPPKQNILNTEIKAGEKYRDKG